MLAQPIKGLLKPIHIIWVTHPYSVVATLDRPLLAIHYARRHFLKSIKCGIYLVVTILALLACTFADSSLKSAINHVPSQTLPSNKTSSCIM